MSIVTVFSVHGGAVDGRFGGSAGVAYMLAPHEVVQASVQRSTRREKREAHLREVLARQVLTGMALRVGGEQEREVLKTCAQHRSMPSWGIAYCGGGVICFNGRNFKPILNNHFNLQSRQPHGSWEDLPIRFCICITIADRVDICG